MCFGVYAVSIRELRFFDRRDLNRDFARDGLSEISL
jgi:hypothetical protein